MHSSVIYNQDGHGTPGRRVPTWVGYVAALLIKIVLTLILVITYPLVPVGRFPIAYVLGIGVVAYLFGLGPAIFAFFLAALAFDWFFVPPTGSLWPLAETSLGWANWIAFLLGTVLVAISMLFIRRLTHKLALEIAEHIRTEEQLRHETVRFDRIFSSDVMGAVIGTPDGRVLRANDYYLNLIGYTRDEVEAGDVRWDSITPEEYLPLDYKGIQEMRETGVTAPYEKEYVRKDGSRVWVLIADVLIREPQEEIFGFTLDITARKRAEAALRESEEEFRSLFESSPDAIFVISTDANITAANPASQAMFGMTEEELRLAGRAGVVAPDDERLMPLIRERERTGRTRGELTYVRKDGSRFEGEFTSVMLPEAGRGFVFVRDITQRVRAEQALRSERERIAAMEGIAEVSVSARSMQDALSTIAVRIREAMRSHSCTLFLYDEDADVLEACAACNVPGITGVRLPRCECFVWSIFLHEGPSYIRDVRRTPLTSIPQVERAGVKSVLGVPLIGRTVTLGVVYVDTLEEREFAPEDVRLLETMASRTALIIENGRLTDALSQNFGMLQRALLPPKPPDVQGYDIAATYLPGAKGTEIGGDFYDVFLTEAGHLGVLIGDVTGKGIPSASLAATARSTLRAFAYDTSKPGESLRHTNSVVCTEVSDLSLFVTAFAAAIDHRTGRILYASAGHPPPAIWHREPGEVEFMRLGDPPVGVFPIYDYEEHEVMLSPGDKIVFYTDGLDEARHNGELFGLDRVAEVIRDNGDQSPEELMSLLVSAATGWANGRLQDDMAIVVIECVK